MGEAGDKYDNRLRPLVMNFLDYCEEINSELCNREVLVHKDKELLKGISRYEKELAHIWGEIINDRKTKKEMYRENTENFVGQVTDIMESWKSKIRLHTPRSRENNKFFFTNSFAVCGMNVQDLEDVVADYKKAVRKTINNEKFKLKLKQTKFEEEAYRDQAIAFKYHLDELAGEFFKTTVATKINVDIKKENPDYNFATRNSTIGREQYEPSLYSSIAHEGPFGHQLMDRLSKNYFPNNYDFRHTAEGLATVGQKIALGLVYKDKKGKLDISEYFIEKSLHAFAFHAALEKFIYYDALSPEKISHVLDSPVYPKKVIKNMISSIDRDELRVPEPGEMFPRFSQYYVGYKQVRQIYDSAVKSVPKSLLPQAMRIMYTGFRTPARMAAEVGLFLKQLPKKI